MTSVAELHRKWSRGEDYREVYEALGPEFERARAIIEKAASEAAKSASPRRRKR